jgi:hypothetical protein
MNHNYSFVMNLLSYHEPIGNPQAALNRLVGKAIDSLGSRKGARPCELGEWNTHVELTMLTLAEIGMMASSAHNTDLAPARRVAPIIVCVWQKRRYLLDGRRRYNLWRREKNEGPHAALIVHCSGIEV